MALGRRHDARGVGQPGDAVVLEGSRREVAHGAGAIGGDHVDVLGPVEHPPLVVETAEEALDLARCLPALVLGFVPGVAGPAGEGQPAAVRRPGHVADAVGHGDDGAHLAWAVDREHMQRRLVVLLATARGERQPAAVRRPCRALVAGTVRQRHGGAVRVGQPHAAGRRVLGQLDGRDDEGDALAVWADRGAAGGHLPVEQTAGDLGVRGGRRVGRWCRSHRR